MKRILAILALAALPLLAGCSPSVGEATAAPTPKKIFVIKVMTATGVVIETHRATFWSYGNDSCITYLSPDDPSNYLAVCNHYGVISIRPEE